MDALQAIVLGIVQGLTEFLPVSSSGHLRIVPAFAGWEDPGAAFTAVTQLGTMAAVLAYFRKDLWNIANGWTRSLTNPAHRGTQDARMGWLIILGTVPISIIGLTFADTIENDARNLTIIGITLIALGLVLYIAEHTGRHTRDMESLTWRDGLAIGFAQAAALIPGVSRSGATISAGLFLGLERATAARFSFLLSVPAVVLSGIFQLGDIGGPGSAGIAPTAIATLLAFISGYASIAFLLRFLVSHTVTVFVIYRVGLGIAVLALVGAGAIA